MSTAEPLALTPGFADPEGDGQAVFRAVLEAMSHPGRVLRPVCMLTPPPPFPALSAALAITLCDAETPIWLDAAYRDAAGWLRFHCGAPVLTDASAAAFAFLDGKAMGQQMDHFSVGTAISPEDAATLVVAVDSLAEGRGLVLSGPGIDGECGLAVSGLCDAFWADREKQAASFPMGWDAILVAPDGMAGLPRTTRVREG